MPDKERGFFIGAESGLINDKTLSSSLVNFFKNENYPLVADFGCGVGFYVNALRDSGIQCHGYDGNPKTKELTHWIDSRPPCEILDLSRRIPTLEKGYEWILSLEVGEHIPKKYEPVFINNIHRNNIDGVVLSWAVKGQGGNGHYNEQDNDYIKSIFKELGYSNDIDSENELRKNSSRKWFKNTIMVFRK